MYSHVALFNLGGRVGSSQKRDTLGDPKPQTLNPIIGIISPSLLEPPIKVYEPTKVYES